jgi:putative membrane protein
MLRVLPSLHVARRLAAGLALALGYSAAVTAFVVFQDLPKWIAGNEIATVLTVALSTLIVLRNNAANDRWWEARKLWGQLINELRNLALKARAHVAVSPAERTEFGRLLIGFAHALRLHLRGAGAVRAVPGFEHDPTDFPHAPGYVAEMVHQALDRWNRGGNLHDTIIILDPHARALMDVCGACERIRNTPLASSYRALLWWAITLYVVFTPWAVAIEMGWWGLTVLAIGFGFLLGIEMTAEVVEEPFGTEGDDLPLEAYCQTIEEFVTAALGDAAPRPTASADASP